MNFLTLFFISYSFTAGVQDGYFLLWDKLENPYGKYSNTKTITTDFNIDFNLWRFYAGGGIDITSKKEKGANFYEFGQYSPIDNNYRVQAGYKGKFFDVKYSYWCNHPVKACLRENEIKYNVDCAAYEFSIQFNHELRFK